MPHTLLHIYGPIAIHSYGFMIALGLLAFIYLIRKDPRFTRYNLESHLLPAIIIGIIAGIIGGRALFFYTHPELYSQFTDLIAFWEGGFSILGTVIAVIGAISMYFWYVQVPIIRTFDLAATYIPLMQSISRIGCFFAGCCYGIPTTHPWGIMYTDTQGAAPLYACLHPAQLYSAALLLIIFAFMYFVARKWATKPGQQASLFLLLIAAERYFIDFWRGDRIINHLGSSINQQIAFVLMIVGLIGLVLSNIISRKS